MLFLCCCCWLGFLSFYLVNERAQNLPIVAVLVLAVALFNADALQLNKRTQESLISTT